MSVVTQINTRIYTVLLVLITVAAAVVVWRAGYQIVPTNLTGLLFIVGIFLVMIVVAEALDGSFPQASRTRRALASAALCFAAGLTLGPVLGGIVAALAHTIAGAMANRPALKTIVNAAGIGLATIASAALYFALAEPARSPIGSFQNLLAVLLAAALYVLIKTAAAVVIEAAEVGISPFELFRTHSGSLHVELLTVAGLGGVIPVLVGENWLSIILLILPMLLSPQTAEDSLHDANTGALRSAGAARGSDARQSAWQRWWRRMTGGVVDLS
jgi:hypothetical protein